MSDVREVEAVPVRLFRKARASQKGRSVDPVTREEIATLLGDASRQPDFLIEHLHKVQDRFGSISVARLAALAESMKLAQAEVFEVATFYHHFDIVAEGQGAGAGAVRSPRTVASGGARFE